MPRLECENDARGRFTNGPGGDSQRHDSRFLVVVAVTPGAARSARHIGARRPERERPPGPRAWRWRRARRVLTRWPAPSRGRSRSISPSREGHRAPVAAVPCGDQPSAHRQGGSGGGAPARPLPRQRRGELGVRREAQHPLARSQCSTLRGLAPVR